MAESCSFRPRCIRWGEVPFGPPKMATLALATALVLLGFVLDRSALDELTTVACRSRIAWAAGAVIGIAVLATVTALDPRQALFGSYPDYRGLLTILACAIVGCGGAVIGRTGGRTSALLASDDRGECRDPRIWSASANRRVPHWSSGLLQERFADSLDPRQLVELRRVPRDCHAFARASGGR